MADFLFNSAYSMALVLIICGPMIIIGAIVDVVDAHRASKKKASVAPVATDEVDPVFEAIMASRRD